MYSALLVAKYIIRRCYELGNSISNLKLQKILYFVQAEFLVDINACCFSESIEAWDFGPVIPEVYRTYRVFGSANIPTDATEVLRPISSDDVDRINGVVDMCSQYTASRLVEITHCQAPWQEAYNQPGLNNVITPESIKTYFSEAN